MLTQLAPVRSRIAIDPGDTSPDALLTRFIEAITAIFDLHCHRTLARTVDITEEFPADYTIIRPSCYPIQTVGEFEMKTTEVAGWVLQTPPNCIIRQRCVIYLELPLTGGALKANSYQFFCRARGVSGFRNSSTPFDGSSDSCHPCCIRSYNVVVDANTLMFSTKERTGHNRVAVGCSFGVGIPG